MISKRECQKLLFLNILIYQNERAKLLFLNIFDQNENAHNHRTDVRKLQDVRGHEAGVNIVLTNPDILQVCILLLSSYSPSTSSPSTPLSPTHISCRCAYSPQTGYSNYPHTHQQHQTNHGFMVFSPPTSLSPPTRHNDICRQASSSPPPRRVAKRTREQRRIVRREPPTGD